MKAPYKTVCLEFKKYNMTCFCSFHTMSMSITPSISVSINRDYFLTGIIVSLIINREV